MSFYKDELKKWLRPKKLKADRILCAGNMHDDLLYFSDVEYKECETIDIDPQYKPTYLHDLNKNILFDLPYIKPFDTILAFELFEYLWNPVQAFQNFREILKSGGELWLSVPFIYPLHNPEGTDYLRVTEWGIKKILSETGFEVVEFAYRNWEDNYWHSQAVIADRMKPLKGYKHHNATGFIIRAVKK